MQKAEYREKNDSAAVNTEFYFNDMPNLFDFVFNALPLSGIVY